VAQDQALLNKSEVKVIGALKKQGKFASAQSVYQLLRKDGESTGGHHHHLVCTNCGKTVEVEGSAVEKWANTVAKNNGFRKVSHVVELFGLCAKC